MKRVIFVGMCPGFNPTDSEFINSLNIQVEWAQGRWELSEIEDWNSVDAVIISDKHYSNLTLREVLMTLRLRKVSAPCMVHCQSDLIREAEPWANAGAEGQENITFVQRTEDRWPEIELTKFLSGP